MGSFMKLKYIGVLPDKPLEISDSKVLLKKRFNRKVRNFEAPMLNVKSLQLISSRGILIES